MIRGMLALLHSGARAWQHALQPTGSARAPCVRTGVNLNKQTNKQTERAGCGRGRPPAMQQHTHCTNTAVVHGAALMMVQRNACVRTMQRSPPLHWAALDARERHRSTAVCRGAARGRGGASARHCAPLSHSRLRADASAPFRSTGRAVRGLDVVTQLRPLFNAVERVLGRWIPGLDR